jgi:putative ABC transport system permease protein
METLIRDIRYGIRSLLKRPGFTVVAVLTLALGIGANTAIFSVVNAVLLRPLPFPEPERLVVLTERSPQLRRVGFSMADLFDFKEQASSFEGFAGFYSEPINWGSSQGAEPLTASYITADFFTTLGAQPAMGRAFVPAEDHRGAEQIVIISQKVWRERLRGDPNVIGQTAALDGRPFTVVGVAPAGFRLDNEVELWLPMGLFPYQRDRVNHWSMYAIARLKPGLTLQTARAEMETIARRLGEQYPETNAELSAGAISLHEDMVGEIRPSLLLLLAAVGFVLLIACVNIANLLLVRGAARQKEMAIRMALGAGRVRTIRQLLTESLVLALLGGGVGILLAFQGIDLALALGGAEIPRLHEVTIDFRVLAFSLAASLAAGLLFGLAPAVQTTKPGLTNPLKESGRSNSSGHQRLRGALVISEIAVALVLLIGAGLLLRSFALLRGVSPGYQSDHVLTVQIALPRTKYRDDLDKARFTEQALERVRHLPGVAQAAGSFPLPVYGRAWGMSYSVEDEPPPAPDQFPDAQVASVSPGFFSTLQIPLRQGRDFTSSDTQPAPAVVIIDETLARRHWPNESPIGKRLTIRRDDRPRAIVGLVGSVRNVGLGESVRPQIYIPHEQRILGTSLVPFVFLALRTAVGPMSLTAAVRSKVAEVDPDAAISEIAPMDALLDNSVAERRFSALLLGAFSTLALILAAIGIYGVMSYVVTQRTREIGVRMALGARSNDVLRLVIGQGMVLTLIGVAIGLIAAFGLTRLMKNLLFGVGAADPLTFASVALLLVLIALLACWIPARRATKVDPMVALRYE